MKLIEIALLYVLLMLFISISMNVSFQIEEYKKERMFYIEKIEEIVKAHALSIKNKDE